MELPSKDKNGISYLSYSQISLFKRDKQAYYENYILKNKFKGNEYTDFGSKVGNALEKNDFTNFNINESEVLKKVKRLDLFEKKTILNYDDFYVIGFIDTCSFNFKNIIDYKTGGKGKHLQYLKKEYIQLAIYVLSLRQSGFFVEKASIEFITRKGNPYRGEKLKVDQQEVMSLNVDVSYERLKNVYWDVLKTAKEIEYFYKSQLKKIKLNNYGRK